jgi:hypothetical protein
MSEKLTMSKNVQAFVNKYGGIGSKEQDAAFWKEFRKAANAYANVQAKRICDLEHALAEARELERHRKELVRIARDYIEDLDDSGDEAKAKDYRRWLNRIIGSNENSAGTAAQERPMK